MRSGRYRHRATIRQDSSGAGSERPDFSGKPFAENVPGNLYDVSGQETFRGKQIDATTSHIFETRFYRGISKTMRLDVEGLELQIGKVLDMTGRKRYLLVHCTGVE